MNNMKKISIIGFVLGSFVATTAIGGVPGAANAKTNASTPQQQSQQQPQDSQQKK